MLFPIIRVKDNDCENVHIVGTDEHDSLYIDKEMRNILFEFTMYLWNRKV